MPPTEQMRRPSLARTYRRLSILLILLAGLSAAVGAWNGVHRSQDFQWSGAHMLAAHIDPWAEYLKGDPDHRIVLSQDPNYLAILYVLILPLGWAPLLVAKIAWGICNLGFAIVSASLAAQFYGIRRRGVVTVVCLLLMATPVRNSLGNGQQGLLVLLVWCLALLSLEKTMNRAAAAGISYLKFSFAPPVFVYLWLRFGMRAALVSLTPAFAALGLTWLWITGGHDPHVLLRLGLEPFEVARTGYKYMAGDANLMALIEPLLVALSPTARDGLELAAAMAACLGVSWFSIRGRRSGSVQWQMALMATMSLALFKHHPYDGVVLLLPLCHALRKWRELQAKFALALIGYFFYFTRMLDAAHLHPSSLRFVEFGMLMAILTLTWRLREEVRVEAGHRIFEPRRDVQTEVLAG